MLLYEINNMMKRNGRKERVLMMKYVVSPSELDSIYAFLSDLNDEMAGSVRVAIRRTERPYERNYPTDPDAPIGSLAFILFKPDATWFKENCLNKLYKPINTT